MILKTLHLLGPQHGFGLAKRIEQVSEHVLKFIEGTVYTSLLQLQQQGWIAAKMGCFGKQPEGKVLVHNRGRSQATRARDRELGTDFRRDRARA